MKQKWKIVTLVGIIAVTCGAYTWGIPAAVNIKAHKSFIESQIKDKTGFIVDIGTPKLTMGAFPSVWVESTNVTLFNPDGSKAAFVNNPKLKIKLFPLLFKKVEIAKISSGKEEAHFVLTKDKKLLLGQYPLKLNSPKSEFTLSKMDMNLGEYNFYLDDELNSQNVSLIGQYFKHGKYVANKHVRFATAGNLKIGDKSTKYFSDVEINLPITSLTEDKLKINADINKFDLSYISDYVNILSKGKIKKLSGIVDFNAKTKHDKIGHKNIRTSLVTNNLNIIGKDNASSIIFNEKLVLNFNFDTIDGGIHVKKSTIEANRIHASVEGKVYRFGDKIPLLDIDATVKSTRLEDVCKILPGTENLIPEFNLYKLKQYVFYGDGDGHLHFRGKANRPFVTGFVKLRDAYLIHPIKNAPANAKIDLNFIGKKMLLDVFVPTSKGQNVTVKGKVKIDGSKYSELQIKSTDAVVLEPAQEVLNPLHEILKFQLGPVPMMKISGIGNIDMRSAGKKVDPHIWGDIRFKNVTASFNDIHNLVLKNGSGEVKFNDTKTSFRSYSATINGRPVGIKGTCSVLGKLNVFVTSKGQNIPPLINVINSSPILVDVQKVIAPFTHPQGVGDIFLNIYGNAKNAETVEFNKDLFAKGTITFHNASTIMQDTYLPFTKINGVVNFDQYDSDYDITGFVRNSKLHVKGTGSNSNINLTASSDNFAIGDCSDLLYPKMDMPYQKEIGDIHSAFTGKYNGVADAGNLDYNKVTVDGKLLSNMKTSNPIKLDGGTFSIRRGVLTTSPLKGSFNNNPFNLTLTMSNIYDKMTISNAAFNFHNLDLAVVNTVKSQIKLPKQLEQQINLISDIKGHVNLKGTVKGENIWTNVNLAGTSFVYKPFGAAVNILSGNARVAGDTIHLERVNSRVSSMPVFVNGSISNIFKTPNLNVFASAKPTQLFFDRFINSKSVYPVKVKGDVNFNSSLRGPIDRISAVSNLNVGENSSIYYLGATLAGAPTGSVGTDGMTTNPVSVVSDTVIYPNKVKINSLKYNQIITSQNKKKSVQNQLNATGEISLLNNNVIGFKNFRVKTAQPTNARIFNVLLKKPTIKQGVFTSDVLINGTSLAPRILGDLNITSIDIPLLDATIRDISIDFQKDFINLTSKGVVLTNDITLFAKILNNPNPPIVIEDAKVQMDELNLNVISKAIDDFDVDNTRNKQIKSSSDLPISPDMVIIKNAEINADKILIKKANATNFNSKITLGEDNILNIENFGFNLANGFVNGKINYNLNTLAGNGEMSIDNADAQIIGENFFDMPGQMYGRVTGDMRVSCTGLSSVDCVNTLSGDGKFNVSDGRMPKLGSLEYLLKAGNLITGGITGLSINGIIDLITPLKTGNFQSISGDVKVKDGIANEINVYSKGKDLNLYLTGSYNISTLVADMEVYGSLSKNFSTLLGRIGNASLNRLFNAIPGVNINEVNPQSTSNINKIPNFDKNNVLRVFKADIFGDINGSNYVKSFRWIKN